MRAAAARPVDASRSARESPRRCLPAAVAALALAALGWSVTPAAARTAYVTDFEAGEVTPIETADNTAGTPIAVGSEPVAVAIAPDGATAYVVDEGDDEVVPIDVATNAAESPIAVGANPQAIAISPDGTTAYIANFDADTVTPIDLATNDRGSPITVGSHPAAIAITPDGKTAYVANQGEETVTPIDTATKLAGTAIGVGKEPEAIAVTPDGAAAYVVASGDGDVVPIDTATNHPGSTVAVGAEPAGIAIRPDGEIVYVTDSGADDVTPIEIGGGTLPPIGVGEQPQGIAVTPGGATAYVANFGSDTVTAIDTATNAASDQITVGDAPAGLAIVPDQAPTAAFVATAARIGEESAFDGSGSFDRDGTVASYQWDFGDGVRETTSTPTVDHVYAHAGTYTATLTVADAEGCSTELVFTGQTASCNGKPFASDSDPVTVPKEAPSLVAAASPGVALGGAIRDTAKLAGGHDPGGQVRFRLYGPGDADCSGAPAFNAAVAIAGDGEYSSPPFVPLAAGTYRWITAYSGDRDNEPALASCGAGQTVTISAPPPRPPTVPPASSPPPAPAPESPSNRLRIGRPRLDQRRGTARLPVRVPGPGSLRLAGKGVAKARKRVSAAGWVVLRLRPAAAARKRLRRAGRIVVRARVTFTPTGGSPRTKAKRVTLRRTARRQPGRR